jgi:chromosomal replication initiation ATPase DnaA
LPDIGLMTPLALRQPVVGSILQRVAAESRFCAEDILGPKLRRDLCRARDKALFLIREGTTYSYPQIGQMFDRDHTSVMDAVRRHAARNPQDIHSLSQKYLPPKRQVHVRSQQSGRE